METSFVKPAKKVCPTRFLFVSKANISDPNLMAELIEIFSPFGDLDDTIGPVVINQKRHVCYICFVSEESCQRALLATQTGRGMSLPADDTVRLICKYADIERPVVPPPEPECISTTSEVEVPGLTVIEDFVTEEEEQYLLDFCDNRNAEKFFSKDGKKERKKKGSFWESTISRRVQHFGYRFNYETRTLDAPRNMCPVPEFISELMKRQLATKEQKQKQGAEEEGEKEDEEEKQKEEEEEEEAEKEEEEEEAEAEQKQGSEVIMTQLTVNEYYPGQGISSHIGTTPDIASVYCVSDQTTCHSSLFNHHLRRCYHDFMIFVRTKSVDTAECFGPVIYILSLGCGLTMTMTDKSTPTPTSSSSSSSFSSSSREAGATEIEIEEPAGTITAPVEAKKHVWLPARSMLVLRGPARYQWAHGIAPRAMDKVNGELLRRGRRVSFTLREGVYVPTAEDEAYEAMSREVARLGVSHAEEEEEKKKGGGSGSGSGKGSGLRLSTDEEAAIIGSLQQKTSSLSSLVASNVEKEHVFRVYDEIAQHWHHTRGKRKVYWQVVRNFLEGLPVGCLVADVGCGDGKYFGVGANIVSIGCDRSPNLLHVSRDYRNPTFVCDAVSVPFVSNKFDAAICIAVLHHLASLERRLAVISEIVRVLRVGGQALVQAWALEQESTSKRQFEAQDVLVPWSLQQQFVQQKKGNKDSSSSIKENDVGTSNHTTKGTDDASSNVVFQRFCHVYKEGELEGLIEQIPNCRVLQSGFDRSNWFILIEKIVS